MWELRGGGELAERALAAVRGNDDVALCRATAASLWGLDVRPPGARDWPVELLVAPGGSAPRGRGVRTYRAAPGDWPAPGPPGAGDVRVRDPVDGRLVVIPGGPAGVDAPGARPRGWEDDAGGPGDPDAGDGLGRVDGVGLRAGVRLTDPPRTALDCARFLPRYPALAALDAFAHAGVAVRDLRRRCARLPRGAEGLEQAAELLPLANWRAQSPEESWARLLIVDAGLPRPWAQVPVDCPGGPFYLDLGYPRHRTGVEYDGEDHHTAGHQRAHDRRRRELIRAAGWDVLVVTRRDIHTRPHRFLRCLFEVLLARGWRVPDRGLLNIERRIRRIAVRSRFHTPGPG